MKCIEFKPEFKSKISIVRCSDELAAYYVNDGAAKYIGKRKWKQIKPRYYAYVSAETNKLIIKGFSPNGNCL
jgi:hypothetical protein